MQILWEAVTFAPMAQSKQEILAHLQQAGGMRPRHRFGQNFMIDQNLVRLIADAGQIVPGDVVIEVGPGTGTLTEELLSRGARVIAVEIDRDLAGLLRQRWGDREDFKLIEGDALSSKHALNEDLVRELAAFLPLPPGEGRGEGGETVPISSSSNANILPENALPSRSNPLPDGGGSGARVKLVANLPYNIASPLIIELLLFGVESLVFTVQKEVAERLRAGYGSDAYGPLSVMAQMLSRVEVLRTLPPQAFWPPPKIDSALVRVERNDSLGSRARAFSKFVQQLFSARRKTLRRALLQFDYPADGWLKSLSLDPQQRPEELSPHQLLALHQLTDDRDAPSS